MLLKKKGGGAELNRWQPASDWMCGHLVKEAPHSGFKTITSGSHLCSGQLSSFTSDSNTPSSHPRQWWTKVLKSPTSCQIKNYFLSRLTRSPFSRTLLAYVNTKLQFNKKIQQEWTLASYKMTSSGIARLPVLPVLVTLTGRNGAQAERPPFSSCKQPVPPTVLQIQHQSSILCDWFIKFIHSFPSVFLLHNRNINTWQHCSGFDKRVSTQMNSISVALPNISPEAN